MNVRDKHLIRPEREQTWSDLDYAYDFINFLNDNPTEFHAVQHLRTVLEQNGFKYLSERSNWAAQFQPGIKEAKFYTVRNGSAIAAFTVGKAWSAYSGGGVAMVGAHIDALCLKLKPISKKIEGEKDGYFRVGAAAYSGALSPVWWDRDLGLAGRIVVREQGKWKSVLVKLDHPVGRIPTLAPHFGAPAQGPFNKETQMVPILGLAGEVPEPTADEKKSPMVEFHDIRVLRAVAKEAGVAVADIQTVELELFDFQKGVLGGMDREFLIAGRLDDKLCSYAAVYGLLTAPANATSFNLVGLFDNEEIGSLTRQGARGGLLESVVDRVLHARNELGFKRQVLANSFFVSADNTHAVNPNFVAQYLEHHKPRLNVGMTVKFNVNMANTTDALSHALIQAVAQRNDLTLQYFHIRNDSRSGGTIGPAVSAALGVRSIDVGIPQLAMHSIRATTGTRDVALGVEFFQSFFNDYAAVDSEFAEADL